MTEERNGEQYKTGNKEGIGRLIKDMEARIVKNSNQMELESIKQVVRRISKWQDYQCRESNWKENWIWNR